MAVENKWVSSLVEADKKDNAAKVAGGKILCLANTFEVAAADDDGSVYKLAKLPANAIPVKAEIHNDVITAGTDYDLGLLREDEVVQDANIFADALNMSAAASISSPKDGLKDLGGGDPIANLGKKIWELLGLTVTNKREGYILALTANTVGSVAGTISYKFYYIIG